MEQQEKDNKRLRSAWIRSGTALVLAVIFLAVSGFGFIDVLKGPAETAIVDGVEDGAYVSTGISAILGFYCEGYRGDTTTSWYAIVPEADSYVTVVFPRRYFDSAETILEETYDLINGKSTELSHYVYVEGTVGRLSEDAKTKLYDWYDLNRSWMQEAGIAGEVEDFSQVLSDTAIYVDTIGGSSAALVYTLSTLAGLLLIYAVVVMARIGLGKYSQTPAGDNPGLDEEAQAEVDAEADESAETDKSSDADESAKTDGSADADENAEANVDEDVKEENTHED